VGSSPAATKGVNPAIIAVALIALVGVSLLAFWGGSSTTPSGQPAPRAESPAAAATPEEDPVRVARAQATAAHGPHTQVSYPPIPFQSYAPPRPHEVVTSAYQFAAEHPEILSYVPCFCGCERSGHGGNHDCFIKQRAPNGDVLAWDEHGVECTVCIDVANRSRQMHASGASVRAIRAAIDKEFGAQFPAGRNMHTPHPPAAH
jgi:hypothetical protein